jgi:hypothetical protein
MLVTDNIISVRFDERIEKFLKDFASSRGETLSTVIRRLVLRELAEYSYLSKSEKKALGVRPQGGDEK